MPDPYPVVRVSRRELRVWFNEMRIHERHLAGEINAELEDDKPAPAHLKFLSPGSRSQSLRYYDEEGHHLASAHRYLQPDGALGGSGRPDPTYLLRGGVIYKFDPRLDEVR